MKILLAPLNWGLGHASRCIPLVHRLLSEGHEVVLGGDGESLTLLRQHFPQLPYVVLAPLNLRYSRGNRQVWAMLRALPQIIRWAIRDHFALRALLRSEHFDQIISDNRFGLYLNHACECVYITHQLHIMFPRGWRWLEPLAERWHARIYSRFDQVWVPDLEDKDNSLAGDLSHLPFTRSSVHPFTIQYIGPLSRFATIHHTSARLSRSEEIINHKYSVVAVLSGLEPQRSILEKDIIARYQDSDEQVLIVQGLMNKPNTRIKRRNCTIVPRLDDQELAAALLGARHIIARSGYSTIMDLYALGLLNQKSKIINHQLELIPTPGQPEQEYLARRLTSV